MKNAMFPVLLENIPIFSSCPRQSLARLISHVKVRQIKENETIYEAGQPANHMYYVVSGNVKLTSKQNFNSIEGGIEKGKRISAFFGEEAAFKAKAYSNTAVASTATTVLDITKEGLTTLVSDNPKVSPALYESLINQASLDHPFRHVIKVSNKNIKHEDYCDGIGWLLAVIIPAIIYIATSTNSDPIFTTSVVNFLTVFSAAVMMWVFRLVPEYIPAVFVVMTVIVLGIVPHNIILSGYASGSFFMALSVFGIGSVLVQSGLTYRLALFVLRFTPPSGFWYNVSMFFIGILLTPVLPSANGRVSLVSPLLLDVVDILGYRYKGLAATRIAVASFMGVSLLSAAFLTSKSVNFALFGLFPQQVKDQFTWGYWVYASGVTVAILVVGYFIHSSLFFRGTEKANLSKQRITEQIRILGVMQWSEWIALGGIALFILGVMSASIHKIQPPWIGLAILYIMLTLGSISKTSFRRQIDWPFLFMLGGFVGMVKTMEFLSIDIWIAGQLVWIGEFMSNDFPLFVLLLGGIIYVVRLTVPNSAAIILVAAVFMPIAAEHGINPWVIAFMVLIFCDGWLMPYQCSYYLQLLELSNKKRVFSEKLFLKFNIQSNLLRFIAVYASIPFWQYLGLI